MKKQFKKFVKGLTPKSIRRIFESDIRKRYEDERRYLNISYSQEGEDLVLNRFFEKKKSGFYVDVGAHHPIRFSNTYKFYMMGWRGINIDAMPGSMKVFEIVRPDDINLEIPISDKSEILIYYLFNEPALNTFSLTEAEKKNGLNDFRIIDQIQLRTQRLDEVLDKYLPKDKRVDFLSIDVEGLDLMVLKSNNWNKYKPELVLVEDLQSDIEKVLSTDLYNFLKSKGYNLVARTFNTLFFKKA